MDKLNLSLTTLLTNIPATLRNELIKAFNEIARNYREQRWEPSELNGGKFCEVVYTILKGHIEGSFPASTNKPRNMVLACNNLEQSPSTYPRSVRIQMPRMIIALYEIRNNRGVGHAGGDVNPNHMDATIILYIAKWIMAELIRLFHNVSTSAASEIVERIIDRTLPILWKIDGKIRVLDTSLDMKEKTLVVLYHHGSSIEDRMLCDWVEHTNVYVYRDTILKDAHKEKLIEYDKDKHQVTISPKGIKYVEENISLEDF